MSRTTRINTNAFMLWVLPILFPLWINGDPPDDLQWLRQKTGGEGALLYKSVSKLYLTELATGKTDLVIQAQNLPNGHSMEFSPDGSKFAWLGGKQVAMAYGRMRKGDASVHIIATGVDPAGGVHWISNQEVVVVKEDKWFRISLTGKESEVPELTRLGRGGTETDVKLGEDGVWSYVSGTTWKTSDGKSGETGGHCSSSLSPDGKSVTALHNAHKTASLTMIRPGGIAGELEWTYGNCGSKGFDNHRWSSNDDRFVVVQYECATNYVCIMERGSNRATRMGNPVATNQESYGDFTAGPGIGSPWPVTNENDTLLKLDKTLLHFTVEKGKTAPPLSVTVSARAGALRDVKVTENSYWLAVRPEKSNGATVVLTNTVDISPLQAGNYTAAVTVSAANHPPSNYQVNLVVTDPQPAQPAAINLLSPNGGEVYAVGQKITIRWEGDIQQLAGVDFFLSMDGGEWLPLNTKSVFVEHDDWGAWDWVIPTDVKGNPVVSSVAKIKIAEYNNANLSDVSDKPFTIAAETEAVKRNGNLKDSITISGLLTRGALISRLEELYGAYPSANMPLIAVYNLHGARLHLPIKYSRGKHEFIFCVPSGLRDLK